MNEKKEYEIEKKKNSPLVHVKHQVQKLCHSPRYQKKKGYRKGFEDCIWLFKLNSFDIEKMPKEIKAKFLEIMQTLKDHNLDSNQITVTRSYLKQEAVRYLKSRGNFPRKDKEN